MAVGFQFGIGDGRRIMTANLALALTFGLVIMLAFEPASAICLWKSSIFGMSVDAWSAHRNRAFTFPKVVAWI